MKIYFPDRTRSTALHYAVMRGWRHKALRGALTGIDIVAQRFKLNNDHLCTYEVVMRANPELSLFDIVKPAQTPGKIPAAAVTPTKTLSGSSSRRVPFAERPTCTVAEACGAAGLGRTKLYELFKDNAIESLTVGRRRLVRVPSLLKFLGSEKQ